MQLHFIIQQRKNHVIKFFSAYNKYCLTVLYPIGKLKKYNFLKEMAVNGKSTAERSAEKARLVEIAWLECRKVAREPER